MSRKKKQPQEENPVRFEGRYRINVVCVYDGRSRIPTEYVATCPALSHLKHAPEGRHWSEREAVNRLVKQIPDWVASMRLRGVEVPDYEYGTLNTTTYSCNVLNPPEKKPAKGEDLDEREAKRHAQASAIFGGWIAVESGVTGRGNGQSSGQMDKTLSAPQAHHMTVEILLRDFSWQFRLWLLDNYCGRNSGIAFDVPAMLDEKRWFDDALYDLAAADESIDAECKRISRGNATYYTLRGSTWRLIPGEKLPVGARLVT